MDYLRVNSQHCGYDRLAWRSCQARSTFPGLTMILEQ
jgi:hypothetical protein